MDLNRRHTLLGVLGVLVAALSVPRCARQHHLHWSAVPTATEYLVYRDGRLWQTVPETFVAIPDDPAIYYVRARGGGRTSAPSVSVEWRP